jgi:hypothetical protein
MAFELDRTLRDTQKVALTMTAEEFEAIQRSHFGKVRRSIEDLHAATALADQNPFRLRQAGESAHPEAEVYSHI